MGLIVSGQGARSPRSVVSRARLRALGPIVLGVLLITAVAFAVVAYLHFDERVRAYQLLDDPAPYAGLEWYTGILSHAGVLLWCASAAVCAFAGLLLRESADRDQRELGLFLLFIAASNLWMALDDLLLVHEQVAEHLFGWESRHKGEGFVLAIYAGLMALCFWRFRKTIRRSEVLLLIVAIVSFGASIAIDVGFQLEMGGNNYFRETVLSVSWGAPVVDIAEEILKLNGLMLWFVYLLRTALAGVREAMTGMAVAAAPAVQTVRPQSRKRRARR